MNVLLPIGLFAATAVLLGKDIQSQNGIVIPEKGPIQIIFYALLIVSLADAVATYYVRKKMPARFFRGQIGTTAERFDKAVVNLAIIIYTFNLSYSIYGLVLVLMGAEMEIMMLFMAFSLIGYQLFRPRPKYLRHLISEVLPEEPTRAK
jgi:hypothetical protein